MSDDQHVSFFHCELITQPLGRIVRLQASDHLEFGKRRTDSEKGFSRLARSQLAAVPDRRRPKLETGRGPRQVLSLIAAERGQRSLRLDAGADGVGMMNEQDSHGAYRISMIV